MSQFEEPLLEVNEGVGVNFASMNEQFHDNRYEIYYLVKGNVGYFINEKSYNITEGDIVILCPAATSFDMFTNFEQRGNKFKDLVNEL